METLIQFYKGEFNVDSDNDESSPCKIECPICLSIRKPYVIVCGHVFCEGCLPRLKKKECPLCKEPFTKFTKLRMTLSQFVDLT